MIKVAIVILNWNGCEMLKKFLPSVEDFSSGEDYAVYVADNGSTDDSVQMLKDKFPSIHIILLDKNYGFAEGYNLALREIDAQYVVLLNSDVEVTKDWLKPLVEYMDSHSEVAACQPKILSYYNKDEFEYAGAAGGFIDFYGYPFCRGRIFSTVEKDNNQYDDPIPVFWATGAALFIRQSVYMDAGGLDGSFFAHMEEIDLCWRLRLTGRLIVCIPQSVVYHVGGATLKKENPYKTMLNFRNNLIMLYKNLPDYELKYVMTIRHILDIVAALSFFAKGNFANAWAVFKARKQFNAMRHNYDEARAENNRRRTCKYIPERLHKSILIKYFLFGNHTFSSIRWKDVSQHQLL
jgi:GT2 family glycosyltransferase